MTTLISTPNALDRRATALRRLPEYEPDRPGSSTAAAPAPTGESAHTACAGSSTPAGGRPSREEVAQLLRNVIEVLNRRRPAAHLRGKLTSTAYTALCTSVAHPHAPRDYRLVRLRLTQPAASAIEVFGTVARGERTHAFVARLDVLDGRWACSMFRVL
jgi:hypothetical protein